MPTLEDRVARLERSAERWRLASGALAAALGAGVLLALAQPGDLRQAIDAGTIRADRIEIRDPDNPGAPSISLSYLPRHGGKVSVYSSPEHIVASLGCVKGTQGVVSVGNEDHPAITLLGVTDSGGGVMTLLAPDKEVAVTSVASDRGAIMRLFSLDRSHSLDFNTYGINDSGFALNHGGAVVGGVFLGEATGVFTLNDRAGNNHFFAGAAGGGVDLMLSGDLIQRDDEGTMRFVQLGDAVEFVDAEEPETPDAP